MAEATEGAMMECLYRGNEGPRPRKCNAAHKGETDRCTNYGLLLQGPVETDYCRSFQRAEKEAALAALADLRTVAHMLDGALFYSGKFERKAARAAYDDWKKANP